MANSGMAMKKKETFNFVAASARPGSTLSCKSPPTTDHFQIFLLSSKFSISFFSCFLFQPMLAIFSSFCNHSAELRLFQLQFLLAPLHPLSYRNLIISLLLASLLLGFLKSNSPHPHHESLSISELHYLTILVKYIQYATIKRGVVPL